jgi:hypothetical protein
MFMKIRTTRSFAQVVLSNLANIQKEMEQAE